LYFDDLSGTDSLAILVHPDSLLPVGRLFRPIYSFLGTRKLSASFASILTCTLIIFFVFIPLLLFIGALSNEALVLLCHISHHPAVCMQSQWMLAFAGA